MIGGFLITGLVAARFIKDDDSLTMWKSEGYGLIRQFFSVGNAFTMS